MDRSERATRASATRLQTCTSGNCNTRQADTRHSNSSSNFLPDTGAMYTCTALCGHGASAGVWRPSEHAMFTWYVRSEQFFLSAVPVADEAGCFEPGFSSVSTVIKWISVRTHARHVTLHVVASVGLPECAGGRGPRRPATLTGPPDFDGGPWRAVGFDGI